MVDISFKNTSGKNPEILSAIIGAYSFFYGIFSSDLELLECKQYAIDTFSNKSMVDEIREELKPYKHLKKKVSSTSKPFLHDNSKNANSSLMEYYPAFKNKVVKTDKFTAIDVAVDYGITKSQVKFLSWAKILSSFIYQLYCQTLITPIQLES